MSTLPDFDEYIGDLIDEIMEQGLLAHEKEELDALLGPTEEIGPDKDEEDTDIFFWEDLSSNAGQQITPCPESESGYAQIAAEINRAAQQVKL